MTVLGVVIGALLGLGFMWLCVAVGGRYSERRGDAALSLWRARMELRAIREEAIAVMVAVAQRARRSAPPSVPVSMDDELEVLEGVVVDDEP